MNNTDKIEELYYRVVELEKQDPHSIESAMCKMTEEVGELAQVINKKWQYDSKSDEIYKKITEESSDVLICLLMMLHKFNLPIEHILGKVDSQLDKWQSNIPIKYKKSNNE